MITGQLIAMMIMFMITVGFASLLFLPVTCFSRKSKVLNFYWCGFWIFLAVITGTAGASSSLMLLGMENQAFSDSVLTGIILLFVLFVVVGWFHLCGKGVVMALKKSQSLLKAA